MSVIKALSAIQGGLKAPKDQKANRYRYRNIEDINEAVKPLAAEHGCAVVYTDHMEFVESFVTCVSTCTLLHESGTLSAQGFAIVNVDNKNMSVEQSCGSASSYARKYAACGLFAIDDSADDPDKMNADKPKDKKPGAKKPTNERNAAVTRLYAVLGAYADKSGADIESLKQGIKKRPDFADTADFYNRVAAEFEAA